MVQLQSLDERNRRRSCEMPRTNVSLHRPKPKKIEFKKILIVCEGSKTEPNYLDDACRYYRINTASVEIIGKECNSAPITVFRYARDRFKEDPSFDEVYCVIDRDSHPTFDDAVSACRAHPSKRFHPISSYPCFEYWIFLHFQYTRAPVHAAGGSSPGDVMLKMVRQKWPEYTKGLSNCFIELQKNGKFDIAMKNADLARKDAISTGEPNPSTDCDRLLQRIIGIAKEQGLL
jgi:hypothetical protein